MKRLVVALVAVAALLTLGGPDRVLSAVRGLTRRGRKDEQRLMEEDISRFVGEGGAPLGAGAE